MTTIFKHWIKNATGLNFSWNMTQGSKVGSILIDIRVANARSRCLLKWNVKVTLTKHVYLNKVQAKKSSLCFLFKVNALFVKKSHKTGWQKLLIWDNFVSLLFKVTDIQLDDDILSSTCRKRLKNRFQKSKKI